MSVSTSIGNFKQKTQKLFKYGKLTLNTNEIDFVICFTIDVSDFTCNLIKIVPEFVTQCAYYSNFCKFVLVFIITS